MLPQLAAMADRFAVLRALNHSNALHNPWPMLTGNMQQRISLGSAITHLTRQPDTKLPAFVNLWSKDFDGSGRLGPASEALEIANPLQSHASLSDYVLPSDIAPERLADRELLLQAVDRFRRSTDSLAAVVRHERNQQRAYSFTSTAVRDAFDVTLEPESRRDRFGANNFGQSCLLARRI